MQHCLQACTCLWNDSREFPPVFYLFSFFFLHTLVSSRGISRAIVTLRHGLMFLPIRSASGGEAKDLTFHSLTSMNIVNTVDLHCHVSTLWKITQRRAGLGASMWHVSALDEDEGMTATIKGYRKNKKNACVFACVSVILMGTCCVHIHSLTSTIIVDTKSFFFFFFPSTLSPFFNSLSMIQQVIPLDLIPSYLIYTVSFLLSDVVITPTSPAPRRVVPTPAGRCKWRALNA